MALTLDGQREVAAGKKSVEMLGELVSEPNISIKYMAVLCFEIIHQFGFH